jgi:hypothetical protein
MKWKGDCEWRTEENLKENSNILFEITILAFAWLD